MLNVVGSFVVTWFKTIAMYPHRETSEKLLPAKETSENFFPLIFIPSKTSKNKLKQVKQLWSRKLKKNFSSLISDEIQLVIEKNDSENT